jgi:hypothetical protein
MTDITMTDATFVWDPPLSTWLVEDLEARRENAVNDVIENRDPVHGPRMTDHEYEDAQADIADLDAELARRREQS